MNNILYKTEINSKQIPSVVYITPEIASIGLREQDILNKNDYVIKKLPAASILKSWCDNSPDGFIKVIIKDNKLLGAHIISKEASSLVAFLGYFVNENININEISKIIFPHPSMTELISEVLKID